MDTPDDGPRWGQHDSPEAVIRHLATVDHDHGMAYTMRRDAKRRLHYLAQQDGIVAESVGTLGEREAVTVYTAEVRELATAEARSLYRPRTEEGRRVVMQCRILPSTRAVLDGTGQPSRAAGEVLDGWARERAKVGGNFSAPANASTPEGCPAEVEEARPAKGEPGQLEVETGTKIRDAQG